MLIEMIDKEAIYELQLIDCNCNDCVFMKRDIEKRKSFDHLHENEINASWRINYGYCDNLKKDVEFIPNILQLHTQDCFKHRKQH